MLLTETISLLRGMTAPIVGKKNQIAEALNEIGVADHVECCTVIWVYIFFIDQVMVPSALMEHVRPGPLPYLKDDRFKVEVT